MLGVDFGHGDHSVSCQFRRAIALAGELHSALAQVGHAGCELILLRKCADACKVIHLLRAAGPSIDPAILDEHDAQLARSLQRCLGPLDSMALDQASLGVDEGGLGLRRAANLALPAFLASRAESRWIVELLSTALADFGLLPEGVLQHFDNITAPQQIAFESHLSVAGVEQARALLSATRAEAGSQRRSLHALVAWAAPGTSLPRHPCS